MLLGAAWPSFIIARTVRVPQDAPTIQSGFASLLHGDTLSVDRGVYIETLVAPAILFKMIGHVEDDSSGQPLTIVDLTDEVIDDSTAVLTLPPHSHVVIENFDFRNPSRNGIRSWADSVMLRNCILDSANWGFRQVGDSIAAHVVLEHTRIRANYFSCVSVRNLASLRASNCVFSGLGDNLYRLVGVSESVIDSCSFHSDDPCIMLVASGRSHRITNCNFGPSETRPTLQAIYVDSPDFEFSGNSLVDCSYDIHLLDISTLQGDSVVVDENMFERCHGLAGRLTSLSVVQVNTSAFSESGATITNNTFIECSGNRTSDDLALTPFFPSLVSNNRFIRDSLNGLPSIAMSPSPWQPTPAVLRDNVFEECGFAVLGSEAADGRFNYWGHSSGPFHEALNPLGLGDTLAGDMQFIPWLGDSTSDFTSHPEIEKDFSVSVHPNPFNSTVTIEYALIREQKVKIEIYDVLGRNVETLFDDRQSAGVHSILWQADSFTSGVYVAKLSSPYSNSQAVKLLLLK